MITVNYCVEHYSDGRISRDCTIYADEIRKDKKDHKDWLKNEILDIDNGESNFFRGECASLVFFVVEMRPETILMRLISDT